MKAMILSAGYGKRLQPLTKNCPKPLLKINNNETLLSNTLKFLIEFGIKKIVINTHYLADQIADYIKKNKFNSAITIIEEKGRILDTGGGILNAISHFSNEPFLVINPDTVWSSDYIKELKLMEKNFLSANKKCSMLVVDKDKSFDKKLKGDFNLDNNLIKRKKNENLKYIYTGLQIVRPEIFLNFESKFFSINKIWDKLIETDELYGEESNISFLHVSNLDIYKNLQENNFKR
tara:strand:- start:2067 stop:2768 length:702 start_codon:yes stop_codon:yes gene_type:complete